MIAASMRFVSGEEIRRTLTFPALIKAMEASHRRARMETRDVLMGPEAAHYFVRSATAHGRAFGSKLIASFPGRQPAVQAIYVLFDGVTGGRGRCSTAPRSRAEDRGGLRARGQPPGPADPQTMVMVGAGAMAPWLVRAHRSVRPSPIGRRCGTTRPRRILRPRARAEAWRPGDADLAAAVRQAQVISPATRTTSL
jgi:ornithine cyclodeaminase